MGETESQISAKLRDSRERSGLTQMEAAAALGVDPQTISRWERGERRIKAEDYERAMALYSTFEAGLGQTVSRGTSPEIPPALEVIIKAFEREAARTGATDWELDHIAATLRSQQALRMLRTDAEGKPLSAAEQVEELGYQIDGLKVWLSRRIAARTLPPHVTTDEATSPRKVPVPHPTKGRGNTQRKTGS